MFGEVDNPLQSFGWGSIASDPGPKTLLSAVFQLIAVAAGLYALFNFVVAGMQYITSQGDPKQTEEAWKKIYMSFIGLAIIVLSFIVAAVIGAIFFNDPNFIFNPQVVGPGTL